MFKEWDYKKPNISLSHYHLLVACQNEQDIISLRRFYRQWLPSFFWSSEVGKPFSHRWPFNLHFTCLFFWLTNLFGWNAKVRAGLINDWRLLKSPWKYSHSWIILSIAVHHFYTLVWYLIYQIQLLALVRRHNSIGLVFRMLDKIRNPLAAELLSNGGDPTTVALSIGCLRVCSWSSAGIPQQHLAKRLVVSGRAGGSKEKNTSISLSSNFWCGWEKQSDRKDVKWQMAKAGIVFIALPSPTGLSFRVHSSSLFRPLVDNGSEARVGAGRTDGLSVQK